MKKTKLTFFLKKMLLSVIAVLTFTACSNDDDDRNETSTVIKFLDNEAEAYKGETVSLKLTLEGSYNQSEMSLFIGDTKVESFSLIGHIPDEGEMFYTLEFNLPASIAAPSEASIILQTKDTRITGPKLKIGITYYSSHFGSESLGRLNMAMTSIEDGKIVSVSQGLMLAPLKRVTFNANSIDKDFFPIVNYTWSTDFTLPDSPTGVAPVYTISGNRLGMDTRNGITYFPLMYYSKAEQKNRYYLAQEYRDILDFCGSEIYTKSTFDGSVTDVRIDANNNIYVIDESKPNCIQKMSVTKSPEIWVGSATESGSVDGNGAAARFENVISLQRDSKDNLYVAQKNVIRKITPDGTVSRLNKFAFQNIEAFTITPDDKIYVLDGKDNTKITIINAAQTESIFARILDPLNPGSSYPIYADNMAVSTDGIVYFRKFSSAIKNSSLNILVPN